MSSTSSSAASTPSSAARNVRGAAGPGLALVLLAYAYLIHRGFGAPPGGGPGPDPAWYEPTRFLLGAGPLGALVDRPVLGIALLALPAALGALGVFGLTRSAVARWIAVSSLFAVMIFAFYGLVAERIWEFFGWRGSLVMLATALCVGGAASAPTLTRAWLERSWPVRLLLYVPIVLGVMALLRNATGTDERLPFNFSPWPAVPIFGLEMGAYAFVGLWLGLAAGLVLLARARDGLVAGAGLALGVGIPVAWMALRFGGLETGWLVSFGLVAAVALAVAALAGQEERGERLTHRAGVLALAALLAGLPLLAGRAWADSDFAHTRHVRAQAVIDALARYYEREQEYPEELDELVDAGDLERIPRPRVGFGFVYALAGTERGEFSYQNLGSSYVLEFDAPEWVQCAYNPPWDYGDENGEELEDEEELGEAWSCPESRPDLW